MLGKTNNFPLFLKRLDVMSNNKIKIKKLDGDYNNLNIILRTCVFFSGKMLKTSM